MSDPIPIVYNTPDIGARLRELERERLARFGPKPLALPPGVVILLSSDKNTTHVPTTMAVAFMLQESATNPFLSLVMCRDGYRASEVFRKMVEFLREDFPSVAATPDHRITITVEDAARLAARLRVSR